MNVGWRRRFERSRKKEDGGDLNSLEGRKMGGGGLESVGGGGGGGGGGRGDGWRDTWFGRLGRTFEGDRYVCVCVCGPVCGSVCVWYFSWICMCKHACVHAARSYYMLCFQRILNAISPMLTNVSPECKQDAISPTHTTCFSSNLYYMLYAILQTAPHIVSYESSSDTSNPKL